MSTVCLWLGRVLQLSCSLDLSHLHSCIFTQAFLEFSVEVDAEAMSLSKGVLVSKGGARHKPEPVVDVGILAALFGKHKEVIANFGAYEHISRNQAAKGVGLVHVHDLLVDILTACPTGDFPGRCAKDAMLTLVVKNPELNTSIYNSSIWAGQRCERLGVILNHIRRLAREPPRYKQAALALTGAELSKLGSLLKMVRIEADTSVASGLCHGLWSDDDETVAHGEDGSPAPVPRKRLLKKTASEASVDSQGWPKLLGGEDKSPQRMSSMKVDLDEDGYPLILGGSSSSSSTVGNRKHRLSPLKSASKRLKIGDVPLDEHGYPKLLVSGHDAQEVKQQVRPAAKVAMAAPAGRAPLAAPAAADAAAVGDKTWGKMWYKNSNAVGIRREKHHADHKQIFSFSCTALSKEDLMDYGEQCKALLRSGHSEEEVELWVRTELAKHLEP